jgi:DNA-binding transcriptional ArsR family regulator
MKLYLSLDLIKKMVYNNDMDMFVALADPTRRNIIELLANSGELPATAIYQNFPISSPAVSQHLKVLREARLVTMEKRAQQHVYRLNPQTLSEFEAWVQQVQESLEERFEALDKVLEAEKAKLTKSEQESR